MEKEIKFGGKEAILAKSLTITSPSGETHTVSWGKGNVTTTNLFIAEKAAGTWSVYMTGTNIGESGQFAVHKNDSSSCLPRY